MGRIRSKSRFSIRCVHDFGIVHGIAEEPALFLGNSREECGQLFFIFPDKGPKQDGVPVLGHDFLGVVLQHVEHRGGPSQNGWLEQSVL